MEEVFTAKVKRLLLGTICKVCCRGTRLRRALLFFARYAVPMRGGGYANR
jgi:hypothetical protein